MKKSGNIMFKNLRQSIRNSLGRYVAIIAIIALGASIFVGLRTTKSDMVATGQEYMDAQNMFDLRLLSTYGWSLEDVERIAALDGVEAAEGVITLDVIASMGAVQTESVYKFYAIPDNLDKVYLQSGRMPESPEECLLDGHYASASALGTTITVSDANTDATLDSLKHHTLTVVGLVSTPLYMDISRGSTTIGNGTVFAYLYLPRECFDVDYYSEIHMTIPGKHQVYSEEYNTAMEDMADRLEPLLEPIAQERYERVRREAEEAYADGLAEYQDGLAEYEDGRREAEEKLEDARLELLDAQAQVEENRRMIADGLAALEEGQAALEEGAITVSQSRQSLAEAKAEAYAQLTGANTELYENYKTVSSGLRQVEDGLIQINSGLSQLDSGIAQLESGLTQLDVSITLMQTLVEVMDTSIRTAEMAIEQARQDGAVDEATIAKLEENLQRLREKQGEYNDSYQELLDRRAAYGAQLSQLEAQRAQVQAQKEELEAQRATLDEAMEQIDAGFLELEASQAELEKQFAAAEAQIEAGQVQIQTGQLTLDRQRRVLEEGQAELAEAEEQLKEGWAEYFAGKDEAARELSDAQLQLCGALVKLQDARRIIDEFRDPDVYALGRTTNVGYLALDSNSDIVAGVAKVFPAFFLLVAALVCITTMTRMVEEERTQIGTLKALGYSSFSIISKYLLYAGSAAVLGCTLGVVIGSVVFPLILWNAYCMILNLTPHLVLHIDLWLCVPVVLSYTAVCLLVTWYCCYRALKEVPAELIRPKPPTSGKKIFLEYLPFWNRISFLNKVMLRNVFRYRQRLLMMLVGIGGCMALLLTGFGIRDSIVDIVSYQYAEVTQFDLEVRFAEGMRPEEQADFRKEIGRYVDNIGFFYETSADMDFENSTKTVSLISAGEDISSFFDFHAGGEAVPTPGPGQALLSIGIAEKMGIQVGDTVTLRTADMEVLKVGVSGIFDNHVYNYAIVSPETVTAQWGETPENQMAFITVKDSQDAHYASAKIIDYDGVMSVTVSQDMAEQVSSMLQAMDLVVATVVFCAGMLAVTVLYNLTNINITERLREIATIKVLGFNAVETAAYVFKENFLLTGLGALAGLGGGWLLLVFVMSQIQVDMVWFTARLLGVSYVLSILLTFLAAVLVDFVLYFKLERINMAEALKSVE